MVIIERKNKKVCGHTAVSENLREPISFQNVPAVSMRGKPLETDFYSAGQSHENPKNQVRKAGCFQNAMGSRAAAEPEAELSGDRPPRRPRSAKLSEASHAGAASDRSRAQPEIELLGCFPRERDGIVGRKAPVHQLMVDRQHRKPVN